MGAQALSRAATYVDAIPWKGSQPSLQDPAIADIALGRLCRIAECLRPRLMLALGVEVASLINAGSPKAPIACNGVIGSWEGILVPMYHPASYGLLPNAYLDWVAATIRAALATPTTAARAIASRSGTFR